LLTNSRRNTRSLPPCLTNTTIEIQSQYKTVSINVTS
jgi:hypothetical protein